MAGTAAAAGAAETAATAAAVLGATVVPAAAATDGGSAADAVRIQRLEARVALLEAQINKLMIIVEPGNKV